MGNMSFFRCTQSNKDLYTIWQLSTLNQTGLGPTSGLNEDWELSSQKGLFQSEKY